MKNLIVEITNKEGIRIERICLTSNGISIGRAWDSDVIIQDRFVDADHLNLALSDDQQILISDLSSTNGTSLVGKSIRGEKNAYRLGDVLNIGDTRLKIFDAHDSVAATSLRSTWFLLAERFSSFKALSLLTVLALMAQAALTYSGSTAPVKVESVIVNGFGGLLLLLAWSLLLGFIAKLLRGESNIKALWGLGSLAIIMANIISVVILISKFNLQDVSLGRSASIILFGIFSVWLLAGVLSYTTSLGNRSKWLSSICVVLGLYAIVESDEYLKEPHQVWSSSTKTEQATLPPAFLLRKGVSITDYIQETNSLFEVQ